jgi:hypothetical protein
MRTGRDPRIAPRCVLGRGIAEKLQLAAFAENAIGLEWLRLQGRNVMPEKDREIAMLRAEVEMLMGERGRLLQTAGAAAVFVANMDSNTLPEQAFEAAELLASSLNELDEDTLQEALEVVKARVDVGERNA